MKIFVDTAVLDEIKEAHALGILDGVTTNPSLVKKAVDAMKKKKQKVSLEAYFKEILKLAKGTPVSLEVTSTDYHQMVQEGIALFKRFNPVAKNVYIKIPVNPSFRPDSNEVFDGIKAIKKLSGMKIPINCTLVFSPEQALFAAKAGAKFVSPFAGRIDDFIRTKNKMKFKKFDYFPAEGLEKKRKIVDDNGIVSGVELVAECVEILREYNLPTEVLAASIRNPRQLRECALAGADIATVPFPVLKASLIHHKTMEGMKNFTADIVPEYARFGR